MINTYTIYCFQEVSSMFHKKLNRIISLLICAALLICALPISVSAATKGETVRIGACPDFGIYKTGSEYSGYAYDYLMEIQKYTGHKYTFVEASSAELVEMLTDGIIDAIPCVSTDEYNRFTSYYNTSMARSSSSLSHTRPEGL